MSSEITHHPESRRFLFEREGRLAHLAYRPAGPGVLDFTSTWVDPALRGRGIGARIAVHALEWAEAEGYRVVPSCWFVREVMERHPRFHRLIARAE
jgi:uncharacterized protein